MHGPRIRIPRAPDLRISRSCRAGRGCPQCICRVWNGGGGFDGIALRWRLGSRLCRDRLRSEGLRFDDLTGLCIVFGNVLSRTRAARHVKPLPHDTENALGFGVDFLDLEALVRVHAGGLDRQLESSDELAAMGIAGVLEELLLVLLCPLDLI